MVPSEIRLNAVTPGPIDTPIGEKAFPADAAAQINPSGIGAMTMKHSGWGVRFLDYDDDGWKDLLITQGHDLDTIQLTFPDLRYKGPMLLARNTAKRFVDISGGAGEFFKNPGWVAGWLSAILITTNDWMP